eukprot:NODE_574_length_5874_cov_0.812294.p5 type:complete len:228 gc:universal NODE_574_length_5874_cov_0.812294:2632-3315(+)
MDSYILKNRDFAMLPREMRSSESSLDGWIGWYLRQLEYDYLVDVDEDFYLDKFNLTGLQNIMHFPICYEILSDHSEIQEYSEDAHYILDKSTRHLYGMIHARYVLTTPGMRKIAYKVKAGNYGYCPRYNCPKTPLIPVGTSDKPYIGTVKGYCAHCQDIYSLESTQFDGAYFSTTLPHLLLLTYPELIPISPINRFKIEEFGIKNDFIKQRIQHQIATKRDVINKLK